MLGRLLLLQVPYGLPREKGHGICQTQKSMLEASTCTVHMRCVVGWLCVWLNVGGHWIPLVERSIWTHSGLSVDSSGYIGTEINLPNNETSRKRN